MYVAEFSNYLKSNGMGDDYINCLRSFERYMVLNNRPYDAVTYNDICGMVLDLRNRGLSDGRINNVLKAIRKYYLFMNLAYGWPMTLRDEVCKFKLIKVPKVIKNVLDRQEFAAMVGNAMTLKQRHRAKIQAVLFFMFYTGLRYGELLRMKRADIDLAKGQAVVRIPNKTQTEHYVYFTPVVSEILARYFASEPETINAFNVTPWRLRGIVKYASRFLPPGKKITPHSLRHSFANMLAESDINLRVAQKLLGHKSITSTLIYYDPDARIVERIYKAKIDVIEPIKPKGTNGSATEETTANNQQNRNTGQATEETSKIDVPPMQ
jgi:integrase/recombinase XerC